MDSKDQRNGLKRPKDGFKRPTGWIQKTNGMDSKDQRNGLKRPKEWTQKTNGKSEKNLKKMKSGKKRICPVKRSSSERGLAENLKKPWWVWKSCRMFSRTIDFWRVHLCMAMNFITIMYCYVVDYTEYMNGVKRSRHRWGLFYRRSIFFASSCLRVFTFAVRATAEGSSVPSRRYFPPPSILSEKWDLRHIAGGTKMSRKVYGVYLQWYGNIKGWKVWRTNAARRGHLIILARKKIVFYDYISKISMKIRIPWYRY